MKGDKIRYRRGFKYVLEEDYRVYIGVYPENDIWTDECNLSTNGWMTIKKGTPWDGPSGLTIDTKNSMRASLVHDMGYKLIRKKLLTPFWRDRFDDLLRDIAREDEMSDFRSRMWHDAMKTKWAKQAAKPGSEPYPVIEAP